MHRFFRLLLCTLWLLPASVMAESIQIDGPNGSLSGELVTAEGAQHILVIIPGSGPIDRDGNSSIPGLRSDTYKLLAEGLKDSGISSLRIDKRGLFSSAAAIANPNAVQISDYADDARQWVKQAAELAPCVWLAGHSEGGLVALLASQEPPPQLCGVILMATPGRPIGTLMIEQFAANPANAPLMTEINTIVTSLVAGHTYDPASISPVLQPLFSSELQPYMIDLFSYDPVALAANWPGKALVLQGDADLQVTLQDAALLEKALPQAQRIDLAGATHMLKQSVAGNPLATYSDPTLPLHPDLIPGLVQFLNTHSKTKP